MINFSNTVNRSVEFHLRIILLLALVLRLHGLTAFSLSNDELSALSRLQFGSFHELIQNGVYPDFHPAGVQVFLYGWTAFFGFSEWMVRLPFALMGVVSVFLLYRIGRAWFGPSTGLLAAGSLAILMFPLLYSQIARPYSPGLLCSLSAVFFLTRFLGFDQDKQGDRVARGRLMDGLLFVLSITCCMYIHYFSFLFAGLVCLSGLFFLDRSLIFKYALCGLAILVLYLPGVQVMWHQLGKSGLGGPNGWLSAPDSDVIGNYLDYIFNDSHQLKLIFFVAFTGVVLVYRGKVAFGKWHLLSLVLFGIPVAIAYYYSLFVNPVFQFSILLFSTPFLLLFLFSFFPAERYGVTAKFVLSIIIIAGLYSTIKEKRYYHKQHFTEFRTIAQAIDNAIDEFGKDAVTIAANVHSPYYLNYYLKPASQLDSSVVTRIVDGAERTAFHNLVASSKSTYLVYAYSNIYTPPERDVFIRHYFPKLLQVDTFMHSGIRIYTKRSDVSMQQTSPDLTLQANLMDPMFRNRLDSAGKSVAFQASDVFGPMVEGSTAKTGIQSGNVVAGKAVLVNGDTITGVELVLSIEKDNKKYFYKSIEAGDFAVANSQSVCVPIVAELEGFIPADATVKLYLWNRGGRVFRLRELELNIYRSRPNTFFPPM